jgi:Tfp pilus assembly protein PilN
MKYVKAMLSGRKTILEHEILNANKRIAILEEELSKAKSELQEMKSIFKEVDTALAYMTIVSYEPKEEEKKNG